MSKYPPNGLAVLRAIAVGRVGWATAISEWIDNAFDRHATRLEITFTRHTLTIEDDGTGTDTPQKIVQLGEHTIAARGLGEYGMGGKESLLWAGGEKADVTIVTTHQGVTRRLAMNWTDYALSGWDLADPTERAATAGEIGTRIQTTLQARAPRDLDALYKELGYRYSRAIRRFGKQITFRREGGRPVAIVPWETPAFDEHLPYVASKEIRVGERSAVVTAGVVKEGVRNELYGLTYFYEYRVILDHSLMGCGDFHATRVCGFVELRDGWKQAFTRNKNALTVDGDALFAEVEKTIEPVLKAAERVGSTFALRDLTTRLENQVGAMLGAAPDAKARRRPGTTTGTAKPTGKGSSHKRAERKQPGNRFAGNNSGRALKIGYEELGGIKLGDPKPPCVTLNLSNPFIAQAVKDNADQALVPIIASLIADYDCHQDATGNRYLRDIEPKAFTEQAGSILAKAPILDGRSALVIVKKASA